MLTQVEYVRLGATEEEVGLDQVLGAEYAEKPERLELSQLGKLKEHIDLIVQAETQNRVEVHRLAQTEAVHQGENPRGHGQIILEVDGAQVEKTQVNGIQVDRVRTMFTRCKRIVFERDSKAEV